MRNQRFIAASFSGLVLMLASAALAAESPCTGPAPLTGEIISGPVLHVIDAQRICVAKGPTPDQWVEVKLAAPVALQTRSAMMAATFAQRVDCVAGVRGVAECQLAGQRLVQRVSSADVQGQAALWR